MLTRRYQTAVYPLCNIRLSGVLVADVLSVKMYPHDLLIRMLPSSADIVCTHPMFGPESGRDSWKGLPFVYDVVRVDPLRKKVCNNFISMWKREECKMVAMESFEHDEYAASTQFITHTTGTLARSSIRANGVGATGFLTIRDISSVYDLFGFFFTQDVC